MVEIALTRGLVATVSDEDAAAVRRFKWYAHGAHGRFYAVRRGSLKEARLVWMHREILGNPDGEQVDHINNDSLDNRRENLRAVSHRENIYNSPKVANGGVSLCKQTGRWFARATISGKRVFLGRFLTRSEAEAAVDAARSEAGIVLPKRDPAPSPRDSFTGVAG